MPAIIPNRYPLDYTGVAESNLIQGELVQLTDGAYRAFSPLYSPFFKKNIQITDNANGQILQSSQYKCLCIVASASAIAGAGNEVYSIVVIVDSSVSNNLSAVYQTVGGYYTTGYESILQMVTNLFTTNQIANNDPVDWNILENLPQGFSENLHLHSLGSTAGWEFLAASLEKLRLALLLGDQTSKSFVLSYIVQALAQAVTMRDNIAATDTPFGDHVHDTSNPHNVTKDQVGLNFVQNYAVATLQEAYAGTRNDVYLTADQVRQVAQDRIDMGLDAHVLDTSNPHSVTKTQVGLALVQNYDVASAGDLTTPVDGTTKYVTNHSASDWLTAYFADLNSANNTTISTLTSLANSVLATAQQAQTQAAAALTAIGVANSSLTTALANSTTAITVANQNLVDASNSQSAAITLIQEYLAPAVAQAEAEGYSRGFTDGAASVT
jgi:hypothetical protein